MNETYSETFSAIYRPEKDGPSTLIKSYLIGNNIISIPYNCKIKVEGDTNPSYLFINNEPTTIFVENYDELNALVDSCFLYDKNDNPKKRHYLEYLTGCATDIFYYRRSKDDISYFINVDIHIKSVNWTINQAFIIS